VIEFQITLTALVLSLLIAVTFERFVELVDRRAAARITRSEQPKARAASVLEERLGGWLSRLVPGYLRQVASDLYWASFADGKLQGRSPAAVFLRQLLITLGVGLAAYLALGSSLALAGGLLAGWSLARSDLHGKAETVRLRIAQELPEFVQLMAAESASGAALETVIRRAAQGTTQTAAWFRRVLEGGSGKALFLRDGEGGLLRQAAEESGHAGLISLAIQLGFIGKGVQVQGLLKSLALTFADEFIAQAETRAERLGSNLGVVSAVFYFLPFVVTVLVIVGVPLIQAISG
jgi:Flp pilus assembly protein TadB